MTVRHLCSRRSARTYMVYWDGGISPVDTCRRSAACMKLAEAGRRITCKDEGKKEANGNAPTCGGMTAEMHPGLTSQLRATTPDNVLHTSRAYFRRCCARVVQASSRYKGRCVAWTAGGGDARADLHAVQDDCSLARSLQNLTYHRQLP